MLTLIEALIYNVPRLRSVWDLLIVVIAVAGPALSAFLLWRGRLHRSRSGPPGPDSAHGGRSH